MNRKKKSFTLIEVLITSAITGIIILSVFSAFNTGFLAYKRVDSAFDIYQQARIIFSKLETDLRNSFAYSKDASCFKGSAQSMDFFNISDIYGQDKQHSELCYIKYQFDGSILRRSVYAGIAALGDYADDEEQKFSNTVSSIDLEYACINEDDEKSITWQDSWPQTEEQIRQLPRAVKIKLSLMNKDGKQQRLLKFTKTIALAQDNVPAYEKGN